MEQQRQQQLRDSARAARLLATDLAGASFLLAVHIAISLRLDTTGEGGSSAAAGWLAADATGPAAPTTPALALLFRAAQVARYAVWCLFARPILLGDWAWLLTTLDYLAVTALLLALVVARRRQRHQRRGAAAGAAAAAADEAAAAGSGALWRWWSRHRDLVILLHTPLPRTLLQCAGYATLPRPKWALAGFAAYTRALATRPVVDAVFVFAYHLFVPVRLAGCDLLLPALNTATAFALSAVVGPQLLAAQRSAGAASASLRAPQQRLLTELPLRQQVLVAALYGVLPAAVAYVQGRAAQLGRSVRSRGGADGGARRALSAQHQQQPAAAVAELQEPMAEKPRRVLHVPSPTATPERPRSRQSAQRRHDAATDGAVCSGRASWLSSEVTGADPTHDSPAASPPAPRRQTPCLPPQKQVLVGRPLATAGSAPHKLRRSNAAAGLVCGYRSLTSCAVLSVKVQNHPGSFENYSRQVLEAAPAIAAAAWRPAADSSLATCGKHADDSAAPYLGPAVVVRGCVQLVMWMRTLTVAATADDEVAAPAHAHEAKHGQALDARLLSQLLPNGDQVSGLAVQQQTVAAAAAPVGSAGVQLLHLAPPVLQLSGTATGTLSPPPPEPLRLRLFSQQPQRARLLVVGSGGAAAATAGAGLRAQQVFAKLQVQLCGGEQELELDGEVLQQLLLVACAGAAAGEAEVPSRRARALQLLLLPPVHDDDEPAEGSSKGGTPQTLPLLHFTAPLLVLPAAAAAELRGLWEQVAAEADGDAAAAHAALQPLLSDLSYVLEAAETASEGEPALCAKVGAAVVSADLLTYFRSTGLVAAAELLHPPGAAPTNSSKPASGPPLLPLSASSACATDASGDTSEGSSHTSTPSPHRNTPAQQQPAAAGTDRSPVLVTPPLPSAPSGAAPLVPLQPPPQRTVSLRDLVLGFSPPQLEARFAEWRAQRLAGTAPYLLLVTALPYVVACTRSALQGYAGMTSMSTLNGLEWASDVLALVGLTALVRRRQRLHRQQQQRQQQQRRPDATAAAMAGQQQQQPTGGQAAGGSGSGAGSSTAADPAEGVARQQRARSKQQQEDGAACCGPSSHGGAALAAAGAAAAGPPAAAAPDAAATGLCGAYAAYEALQTFLSPLILFVTLMLTRLGVLAFNPAYLGSSKLAAALVIYRGLFRPLASPLRARCATSAAVVLLYGSCDAMALALAKPNWSGVRLLGLAGGVRAAAAATSAACEWRARGRFLQQRRQLQLQQQEEGRMVRSNGGVAEMKVKDA
ncbi:hypothetical protein HXX76_008665 [Chlamydomonas incerta]|uniref:Uncharacterized protein n=1 Tax=Chlamydomonas incerta TaxID=51695 RepID=A0A835T7D2_CHLIN|nr:hypothetical protein HXX76_008665 [Chlamydomonas incerta]|eukprot:KAG2432936.1 hypothetical protein HXX76_008665 [Chlamydomonas incerta]